MKGTFAWALAIAAGATWSLPPANAQDHLAHTESAPNWSGHYFGGGIGIGRNNSKNNYEDDTPESSSVDEHANGGLVYLVWGFDHKVSDCIVVGAFANFELDDFHRGDVASRNAMVIDRSWSIGGRLGVLVTPRTMIFGSGGFVQAHFDNDGWWDILANGVGPNLPGKDALTFNGYFLGVGVETHLRGNFFLVGEARWADFQEKVTNAGTFGGTNYVDKEDPTLITGRIGIIYKFRGNEFSGTSGEEENPIKVLSYSGFDVANGSQWFYSGFLFALNGDFTKNGFIFRSEGIQASYDYLDDNEDKISATDRALDALLGYQVFFGNVSAIGSFGYEIRDVDLKPDDRTNKLRGTRDGVKVSLELEKDDETPFYFSFDVNYSTAFNAYYGELRFGYKTMTLVFGPEGSVLSDVGGLSKRLGAFVTMPLTIIPGLNGEFTVNGGYQFVGDDDNNGGGQNRGGGEGAYGGSMVKFTF